MSTVLEGLARRVLVTTGVVDEGKEEREQTDHDPRQERDGCPLVVSAT